MIKNYVFLHHAARMESGKGVEALVVLLATTHPIQEKETKNRPQIMRKESGSLVECS